MKKILKTNPNAPTPSPNNSDSSEPRGVIAGIIPMPNDHDIMTMCMDSSSSSSTSIQTMVTSNNSQLIDPFSMLDTRYDMTSASCLFNNMPTCIAQVDHTGDGLFYEDYGILEPSKMGLEGDLSLPPLESRSIEENNSNAAKNNHNYNVDLKGNNNNHYTNNSCFNNTIDQGIKVGDMLGLENNWQGENLRVGEWDLEGFMDNISSFPFLDFQVE